MTRQEENYITNVIPNELKRLAEHIKNAKSERERNFWTNRFTVQLRDFSRALLEREDK